MDDTYAAVFTPNEWVDILAHLRAAHVYELADTIEECLDTINRWHLDDPLTVTLPTIDAFAVAVAFSAS